MSVKELSTISNWLRANRTFNSANCLMHRSCWETAQLCILGKFNSTIPPPPTRAAIWVTACFCALNCSGGEVTRWWSHALAACRQRRKQNISQISGYSKRFILRGQFCFEPLKPAVRSFLLSVSCSLSQLSKGRRPVRPGQVVSSFQGQMETNNPPHSDSHL